MDRFRLMCVLADCDYMPSEGGAPRPKLLANSAYHSSLAASHIDGVGIKTAYKLLSEFSQLESIVESLAKKRTIPPGLVALIALMPIDTSR